MVLAMLQSQRYWPAVCKALDAEHLIHDPRFKDAPERQANACELIAILDDVFAGKTSAEWKGILSHVDIISAPVHGFSDLVSDPQVIANDYILDYNHEDFGPIKVVGVPVTLSETPGSVIAEAPKFGQHTEEVLMELGGYTWEEIIELRDKGAI